MKVTLIPCNPAVTQSERDAFDAVKAGLISLPGDGEWYLLTNLTFSVTHRLQSDEIDIVAVGPPGVRVIEVKHWAKPRREIAEAEADRLTMKARRIGTTLRKSFPTLPHVAGAMLLTRPPSDVPTSIRNQRFRGVQYCTTKDWRAAAGADGPDVLRPHEVRRIARMLRPQRTVPKDGTLRRLGRYVNLELSDTRGAHRVYRGIDSTTRDRIVLHLYDHSTPESQATTLAAHRHHRTLRSLQLHRWAPRLQDSLQDVPGYRDELSFFTVVDPGAPTMRQRSADTTWSVPTRLDFARSAIEAVVQMQRGEADRESIVHGKLSADTILVMYDNSAVITGFEFLDASEDNGEAARGRWSDANSLCTTLASLFAESDDDWQATSALQVLSQVQMEVADAAAQLESAARHLGKLSGKPTTAPPAPPARYWTEGQEVSFRGREYRIVAPLGAGGSGTAYKVVELDPDTREEAGTFVAKVAHDKEHSDRIRGSYQLVRASVGRHAGLSTVFEVADRWADNEFAALMTWIDGAALVDFVGLLPLLAEDYDREAEELVIGWLRDLLEALDVLHSNGLVHGDLSPANIIVDGQDLVLTDYDCASRVGDPVVDPGTAPYCSPSRRANEGASPADDLHALAASFFHVLFDRVPFASDSGSGILAKLDWRDEDRATYPSLVEFLEMATGSSQSGRRFSSAGEARQSVSKARYDPSGGEPDVPVPPFPPAIPQRGRNEVPWLRQLLASYPASRCGNAETRGLDTEFARKTYIETDLEEDLLTGISEGQICLVVLCGNAGDGKTALLQYLADALGLGQHTSSHRIVDEELDDGLRVRINLDGSAAHRGRSANDIMDEFLEPFRHGPPAGGRLVHLLAVNDGRLLEWIHGEPTGTPLKMTLLSLLDDTDSDTRSANPHIAFHHLNHRSRVGRISDGEIATDFLEELLEQLYSGDRVREVWSPCRTCYARDRCRVFEATRMFGPEDVPEAASTELRETARRRLFDALQAVHFRGETHITVRELRAALVYILFGTHYCLDYHNGTADREPAYWDRAFDPESPRRQGEVLQELLRLDPALEAHPKLDRRLLRESGMTSLNADSTTLASERRRAYFEWTDDRIRSVTDEDVRGSLGLARGRNLAAFRDIPLLGEQAREKLCQRLCEGIARIGDLPELALARKEVVPLRITPRTPTETAFWTEKPFARFRLDPAFDTHLGRPAQPDAGTAPARELHRAVQLVYEYEDGDTERLPMSADLFHRLLRMSEGYQLADISMDDTFARLSIFLQRIAREGDRDIMAWSPLLDESMVKIAVERASPREAASHATQLVTIQTLGDGGTPK